MTRTFSCLNCALAEWHRTDSGRLSPSGNGRCLYNVPKLPVLPKAFYWASIHPSGPTPSGGYIDRHKPHTDCSTWSVAK